MNYSYQLLPILVAIIEEKNLTRVASRMGISQPTVSRSLAILREQYNDPLVTRTSLGVEPTPFAQQIYSSLIQGLNALNATYSSNVSFNPHARPYRFSLVCASFLNYALMPKIVEKFSRDYPMIVIDIHSFGSRDVFSQLRNKEYDFLIDIEIDNSQALQKMVIYQDELVLCCREKHPRIQGNTITKSEFIREKHVMVSNKKTHGYTFTGTHIQGLDARKVGAVTSGTIESLCLVSKTDFVCLCDQTNADIFQPIFDIKSVQLPFDYNEYKVCIYWHPSRNGDLANQWFRGEIAALFPNNAES